MMKEDSVSLLLISLGFISC